MVNRIKIVFLVFCIILITGCIDLKYMKIIVDGTAMEPTYKNKQILFADKSAYEKESPKRGDIIIFYTDYREGKESIFIKRVIGLGGETLEIKDGKVFIDKKELKEDYLKAKESTAAMGESKWKIPNGSVFVMGDNRENSLDSRMIGTVEFTSIIGKILEDIE